MKTKAQIGLSLLIIVGLTACSSTRVMTDYTKGIDLSDKRSYRIEHKPEKNGEAMTYSNSLNMDRIERSLQEQLNRRGLTEDENADLLVTYSFKSTVEKRYSTSYDAPYYGGRQGWHGGGMGYATTTETTNTIGELMISVIDAKSNQMLWYAVVSKPINEKSKNREAEIDKAIEKGLMEFPIKLKAG